VDNVLKIEAESAAEASAIYCAIRDRWQLGPSTMPEGNWRGHRISYNGRVWQRGARWPDALAIYNPLPGSELWDASSVEEARMVMRVNAD